MKSLENISDLVVIAHEEYHSIDAQSSLIFSRIAQGNSVFYFQPPIVMGGDLAAYSIETDFHGVHVVQPYLPRDVSVFERKELFMAIINQIILNQDVHSYSVWIDTPKNVPFIRNLCPQMVIHRLDPELVGRYPELEEELKQYTDICLGPRTLSQAAVEAAGVVNIWDTTIHHYGLQQ